MMNYKMTQDCLKFSYNPLMTRVIGAICSVLCAQRTIFSVWRLFGVTGPRGLKWSKWSRMPIGKFIIPLFKKNKKIYPVGFCLKENKNYELLILTNFESSKNGAVILIYASLVVCPFTLSQNKHRERQVPRHRNDEQA